MPNSTTWNFLMLRIAGAIANFWLNSTSDPAFKKDKELQKLLNKNYKFAHTHGPLRFIRFRKGVMHTWRQ